MAYVGSQKHKEYKKMWALRNKERLSLMARERYQKNRTEVIKRVKRYALENKEKVRIYKKSYARKNRERINANHRMHWGEYYAKNRDKFIRKAKKYNLENKGSISVRSKIYSSTHRKQLAKYQKDRRRASVNYRLAYRLRIRLHGAIKNGYKSGSAVRDLGCTIPELKIHLEKQFQPGMTWSNWSRHGWHIDHIMPLSYFNLTDRKQFLQACHYTNLQPLWATENLQKSARVGIEV